MGDVELVHNQSGLVQARKVIKGNGMEAVVAPSAAALLIGRLVLHISMSKAPRL